MSGSIRVLAPLFVLLLGLLLRAWDPPILQDWRNRTFDLFQRLQPRTVDELPAVIVAIDEESLQRYGQWPWPRDLLAELVRRLGEAGATAIAFDAVFAEPDRASPSLLVSRLPAGALRDSLTQALAEGLLQDNDALFAAALAEAPVVLGFPMTVLPSGLPAPANPGQVSYVGESPAAYVLRFAGAVPNLALLEVAAKGIGSFSIVKDADGIVRRVPLVLALEEALYPSLAAEALRVAQGARGSIAKVSGSAQVAQSGGLTGVQALRIGKVTASTLPSGEIWLYDSGHWPERFLPAWQVLQGSLDPARIAGRIVFVGATAAGLFDAHATPVSGVAAGVEQHVQVLEQMLSGAYLQRPVWADGAEVLAVLAVGGLVVLGFSSRRLGAAGAAGLGFVAFLSSIGLAWYAFSAQRLLFDPLVPSAVGLAVFLTAALANYWLSERKRREVRQAFSQYVSPEIVERIAERSAPVELGGENRELTLLFCDIRGFTALSERLPPQQLTRLVSHFLTEMGDAVLESGGTIDKFMGDCIMAFWNAPLEVPRHARSAAGAVLEMERRLAAINAELARQPLDDGPPLALGAGIGLNSGVCSVGNMGSARRLAYTAVGDNVNLASRLEGLTRQYRLSSLFAEATAAAVPEFAFLEIDRVRVKGRAGALAVFTLLGDETVAASTAFRELQAAQQRFLADYRALRLEAAAKALEAMAARADGFPLAGLMEVCRDRLARLAAAPPPPDWDGVFAATEK